MLQKDQKDHLTECYLRDALDVLLEQLLSESHLYNRTFSIGIIDVDRFKKFNDKFGHLFGDEVLKYIASILRLTFYVDRPHLFRYGGDEFIAVFPDEAPDGTVHLLRQCIANMRRRPFLFKNRFYRITISCGISGFPYDGKTPEDLIKMADKAMYFSKRHGRNRITVAGKLKYMKVRNFLIILSCIFTIFWFLFVMYELFLKKFIYSNVGYIRNIKISTKPKKLDVIVLKSGLIFEGRIVEETKDNVVLSLYLEKGEAKTIFHRSEIEKIKYAK